LLLLCRVAARLWAGGSALNVVIVVNLSSTSYVQFTAGWPLPSAIWFAVNDS